MKQRHLLLAVLASSWLAAAFAGACGGDLPSDTTSSSSGEASTTTGPTGTTSTTGTGMGGSGGGGTGGGGTGGAPDCFMNPMTHDEIINACTNAQKIDKSPVLPLLQADGGLPPLP